MSTEMSQTNQNKFEIHDPVREMYPMDSYPTFEPLTLEDGEWTSLYIPVITDNLYLSSPTTSQSTRFQAKFLKSFIENNLQIGSVKRIDFVDRSIESSSTPVKSAYVHFNHWYDSKSAVALRNNLNTHGKHRQNGYFAKDDVGSRFYTILKNGSYASGYFVFKINHKPIDEAEYDVNIHQLSATATILEQKIKEKDALLQAIKMQLSDENKEPMDIIKEISALLL
jgi:hypothetical protein|uniref:Uncharacterized protein n=1 Tax=viral metagenome TaxID=1070528 RepID=A0A6C0IP60_9ZZZZ